MRAAHFAIASLSVLTACAADRPPPREPVSPPREPVAALSQSAPTRSVVSIDPEILRACGIRSSDAHFAFDSARVESVDYPTLDRLVTCFTSGPLAHRHLDLVGHTDPRGPSEYNLALGGSRADGVRTFLVGRGLTGSQVATTSRGEWDAKGTDEATWAQDRRVDVELAKSTR
jgi:peptidoglycan-associated lipoprotein